MSTVQAIRTVLFYLLLSASAFVWGTLSFFIAPILPFRARYRFVVQNWCRFAIWLTRVVAGIRYEVRGLENIPEKPCVILSKHQSTWETFFLSGFFEPLSQVLKRELLYVPFFGWALALLKPICPTGIRVPSGKISTQAPFFRHSSPCLASCLRASFGWLRSMAMGLSRARAQPKNGT